MIKEKEKRKYKTNKSKLIKMFEQFLSHFFTN
jgi:hypothetical protein